MKIRTKLLVVFLIATFGLLLAFNAFQGHIIMQGQPLQPELNLMTEETVLTWGPERQANTYTLNFQMGPEIAKFPDGSFVIVWVSTGQDSDGNGIYMTMFDAMGRNTTPEIRVNTYTASDQDQPSVTGFSDGSFVVVWTSDGQDTNGLGIFMKVFDATGTALSGDLQVNNYTANNQHYPDVCTLFNKTVAVVWASWQDADRFGVFLRLIDASTGTNLTGDIPVNTYTTNDQGFPAVSTFPDGSFVITWASMGQDGDGYGVYAKLFNATGANTTNEIRVSTYSAGYQYMSVVGAFPDYSFVVVWESSFQDGSQYGVFMKIFDPSGINKTNDILVNTYTTDYQWASAVSVLPKSTFVVAWQSTGQDGDQDGVFMKIFTDEGVNQTGDIQVNTNITNNQGFPAVSAFSSNAFVVTWQSADQDGNETGIFFKNCTIDQVPTALGSADIAVTAGTIVYANWTLCDDIGPGFYRISANLSGTFLPISLWLPWTNNTPLIISVNTANVGLFVYRIEYNDSIGQMGIQNEILVQVLPSPPISGFGFLCVMLGLILMVTYAIRSKSHNFSDLV